MSDTLIAKLESVIRREACFKMNCEISSAFESLRATIDRARAGSFHVTVCPDDELYAIEKKIKEALKDAVEARAVEDSVGKLYQLLKNSPTTPAV